jgi:hypothetical protein
VLAVLATACIHRPPLMKLDVPTPIAMVVVLDQKDGAVLDREPRELRRQLVRQLEKRNLVLERLTPEQLAPLSRSIDTKTRLDLIAQALGPGKLFLLVELRVALDFSDLDGAYKWSVDSHLSVSSTDSLATANSTDFGTSVFLHQEFDREREVLRQASEDLADRVGILLDSHFAGRAGTQGGAPPPPVPPAEPPAPGEPLVAPPAEAPPAAPPSPPSTRADWASKPLYFVLLDRFAPDEGTAADVNRADPDDWHGGTLATLRRHLDDLQALGVGSVWLSPVSSCRELKLGVFGPSHCYWVKDLGTIERRFGSLAELRSLRDELHARGMRLVLDIVLNHVSPDSPLMKEHPDWLHPRLAIRDFDDPVQLEKGWLGGLPDLAQEKPAVADYLIATTRRLIEEIQPDGLRLDAVKHIPLTFWARFSRELRFAKPGLLLIGEDLDGDPTRLARVTREGGFDALFDFPLRSAILGAACEGAPVGAIAARLGLDRLDASGSTWVTLLDNHDLPRLATSCGGDKSGLALATLFGLRGIPSLMYGTEAGLQGAADPLNRGDLVFPVKGELREKLAELAALRRGHPALSTGRTMVVSASRESLAQLRVAPAEVVWLAMARDQAPEAPPAGQSWRTLYAASAGGVTLKLSLAGDVAAATALARDLERGAATTRPVNFAPVGVPALLPGDAVAVVGAAPELGAWDPHRAVPAESQVALAANSAYELKLVVRRAHGNLEWQPGPNDIVYVAAGEAPETITLRWN